MLESACCWVSPASYTNADTLGCSNRCLDGSLWISRSRPYGAALQNLLSKAVFRGAASGETPCGEDTQVEGILCGSNSCWSRLLPQEAVHKLGLCKCRCKMYIYIHINVYVCLTPQHCSLCDFFYSTKKKVCDSWATNCWMIPLPFQKALIPMSSKMKRTGYPKTQVDLSLWNLFRKVVPLLLVTECGDGVKGTFPVDPTKWRMLHFILAWAEYGTYSN